MLLRGNVFSKTLEMDTGITIIAPTRRKKVYKVVYLLHGLCSNSSGWVDYTMLPVYAEDYEALFVMPEVGRSFYTDMKYGLRYFSYVADELPKICQSLFNISAQREDTAVVGGSMGGFGALKCALNRPRQYGVCCAISSACLFFGENLAQLRQEGNSATFRERYGEQLFNDFQAMFGESLQCDAGDELLAMAKQVSGSDGPKPRIYTSCGTEDYLYAENERFAREMRKLDFDFTFETMQGAHDWAFFNEALRRALSVIL